MEKEHLEMILEDINYKFDLVLEGQESLRRELYGVRDELSEKIDLNAFSIKALSQKIDEVDKRLDQKIDGVEQRLEQKIGGVEERLDQRIDGVEQRLSKKIDSVADNLDAHRRDTEVHRSYQVREE